METELLPNPRPGPLERPPPRTDAGTFIRRHQHMVCRYLRLLGADPSEADDLMQETFLKVLRRQPAADHQRQLTPALLRKVAHDMFVDARRAARRRASGWTMAVELFMAGTPESLEDERIEALRACLGHVQGRGRRALELRHADGLSMQAAAEELGLGLNGLKSLLRRVRATLRTCVEQQLGQTDPE